MAKAKTHQITIEDVDSYFITRQMAGSFGKYEHKELVLNVKGKIVIYHVYNQGSLVSLHGILKGCRGEIQRNLVRYGWAAREGGGVWKT